MAPAAVVLGLGLGQVGIVVVNIIGQATGGSTITHPSPAVSIVSDVVLDAAFVLAAVYFAGLGGRLRAADFGFRRLDLGRGIGAAVLAGVAYYMLTGAYAALFNLHGKDKLPSELGVSRSTAALVATAAFVCVIAPMAEELFFRGFLFSVLRGWRVILGGRDLGPWLAALVVGILFGLAHTGSAASQYLVPLGFLGFVLCIVRWRTGSLYPCMALHSFNNSLALGVNQLNWSAPGIIILIAASLGVIALITGPLSSSGEPPPRGEPAPV
jgi:membrane protease YdiL (CAAX protease family)